MKPNLDIEQERNRRLLAELRKTYGPLKPQGWSTGLTGKRPLPFKRLVIALALAGIAGWIIGWSGAWIKWRVGR